jgi:protein-tyrosine phosphatase
VLTVKTVVYWIDGPWPGRMAVLPRPRGGDWLEDEVRAWKQADIDVVVSLLTFEEAADFDLSTEAAVCKAFGIEHIWFPIMDRSVPTSRTDALDLMLNLEKKLGEGKHVGIHCRQGIGRSALIAAGLLVLSGMDAETGFQRVSEARGVSVPETAEQRKWVMGFAREAPVRQHRSEGA